MNPIELYLNELIINIDKVKDLDKDDLINILYLLNNNNELIIQNMINIILFKFFIYQEEKEQNNLISIYNKIKQE